MAPRWISSPSKRVTATTSASQRPTARSAMMSNTGWMSVGEREITWRISLVAVCCSSASVRLAFFACSSLE